MRRRRPRLLRLDIEIERAEAPADLERGERPADLDGPFSIFRQRYFPSVRPDIPEVNQVCALRLAGVRTGAAWSGKPFLDFGASDNEALEGLNGVELLRAYAYEQGWTTEAKVELLRNLGAATVAPAVAVAVRS